MGFKQTAELAQTNTILKFQETKLNKTYIFNTEKVNII